jgi:cyclic-di-AMP phosphodiesterase PgpH
MWFRKSSPRRQAIREDVAEAESLVRTPPKPPGAPLAVSLVFFVVATLILYFPRPTLPYREGDRPVQTLRARVAFSVEDPAKLAILRQAKREQSPLVLTVNDDALRHIEFDLQNLQSSAQASSVASPQLRQQFPGLTDAGVQVLQAMFRSNDKLFIAEVQDLVHSLRTKHPLVDPNTAARIETRSQGGAETASLALKPTSEPSVLGEAIPLQNILPLSPDGAVSPRFAPVVRSFPEALAAPIAGYLARLNQPVFTVDEPLSQRLAEYRALTVHAEESQFKADDIIAAAGEPITAQQYRQLLQAQQKYEEDLAQRTPWAWWLAHFGQALVVAVLTAAAALYVTRMNPQANTVGRSWALCGLMLLMLFIAKNSAALLPQATYMVGIAPTLLATIILIIVYNQRFALAIAAIHGLLVTMAIGQSFEFFLTMLAGISVFTFGLKEIRTRTRLIEISFFASVGTFLCAWALGLARLTSSVWSPYWITPTNLATISKDSLWAVAGGILVLLAAQIILPLVERVFKITTSMTLLELCDANRPLLRRLQQEASGTFNHSLTVGILAEAAADAIGVSGLLCRAGAYYHDVGKLSKPQYFIENQAGGPNKHDKLSPAMSLLIIVGHVKDGVELAREYGLPSILHQFIAQHHGTTLVEYFFHAARRRQEEGGADDTEIREAEFRYPGPKPQSKETAILMIADGVESIIRSIPDKSPGKIESAVHNLIIKRLMDNQFSDCDLTLKELSLIETALTKALAGIYHGRVQYPTRLVIAETA